MINWRTTLLGIPPLLAGLGIFFSGLGPVFHSLSTGDFAAIANEWPAVAGGLAAISTGIGFFFAKDSATHSTPAQVKEAGIEAAAVGPTQ
jgi:hypothetical protein